MSGVKRKYHQSRRAEKVSSTRRQIVEAAVELHSTVGPAKTTLSAVAQRAGVSRPTLYSHFPDEQSLIRACTAHWMNQDPPPDPSAWAEIRDPHERVRTALRQIYSHYGRNHRMIGNIFRDMHQVESMRSFNVALVDEAYANMTHTLVAAFDDPPSVAVKRRALVSLAINFDAWKVLIRSEGMHQDAVVDLMTNAITAVREEIRST